MGSGWEAGAALSRFAPLVVFLEIALFSRILPVRLI